MINIQLLLTGNELMSGDIVDSNSAMIAQELALLGLSVRRKVAVSDDFDNLVDEISQMSKKADILIVNGGLGPTVDDLTAQALAKVSNTEIKEHPVALAHLKAWCEKRNYPLNGPNLKQAMLPDGCTVVTNSTGSAPGFMLSLNDCDIYCTPGVPRELATMLKDEILPRIEDKFPNLSHHHVSRFHVFGIGESTLQKLVDEELPDWPEDIDLGFRASMPLLEIKLTTKSHHAQAIKQEWIDKIYHLLGDHLVGEINNKARSFGDYLQELLLERKQKVTFAESCTGGMLASSITKVAGSSQVFDGSFVTYSNEMKHQLIGVPNDTLVQHGAVSEQTVTEMANGALRKTNADWVVAVSGIAGPSGGTEDKPVGTVWLAWGSQTALKACCLLIPAARHHFQHYVTAIGLDLIRRELIESLEVPKYLIERSFTPKKVQ